MNKTKLTLHNKLKFIDVCGVNVPNMTHFEQLMWGQCFDSWKDMKISITYNKIKWVNNYVMTPNTCAHTFSFYNIMWKFVVNFFLCSGLGHLFE